MKINSKNLNILLSFLIVVICGIAGFLLLYFYISRNVYSFVYMDEPRIIVELFENTDNLKHVTFNSLFVSYAGHLTFGTYLILLWQINSFGLENGIYLTYAILAFLAIIYLVFCLSFCKAVDFSVFKVTIFSVVSAFLLFSTKQWETIWFSYGSIIYLSNALFLISFFFISLGLIKQKYYFLYIGNFIGFVAAFLFGSGYSYGFILAVIICELFALFLNAKKLSQKIQIFISEALNVAFLIFLFISVFNSSGSDSSFSIGSFSDFFVGYFYSLASDVCNENDPSGLRIFVGVVILIFSLFSLFLFFKKKMYRKTYLPILCLAFSQLIHFSTLFARFSLAGVEGAVASRYYSTFIIGFIGSIYIIIESSFARPSFSKGIKLINKNNIAAALNVALLVFLCANQFIYYNNESKIAPYRRENAIMAEKNVYFTDFLSDDRIYTDYQTDPEIYRKYVEIIRSNKMYVYNPELSYSVNIGKNIFDTTYSIGAFEIEPENKRFISKETCFVTRNDTASVETISVYNPAGFKDNSITVYLNNKKILDNVEIKKDKFVEFDIEYSVGINTVMIYLAKDNKPQGQDARTLGVLLKQISFLEEEL